MLNSGFDGTNLEWSFSRVPRHSLRHLVNTRGRGTSGLRANSPSCHKEAEGVQGQPGNTVRPCLRGNK